MVKKKAPLKKRFAVKKKVFPKELEKGFFERLKDILPEQKRESVRVKTFIVEKPVYMQAPPTRITAPRQKYNLDDDYEQLENKMDSRKSRYAKKKVLVEETDEPLEELADGEESISEAGALADEDAPLDGEEALDENGEPLMDGMEEGSTALPKTHVRSKGMFNNVWWKKALFWAILAWLLILAVEMGMQAMKLIQVDLSRQWWILLAGIIVLSMIYFKFFEGKI